MSQTALRKGILQSRTRTTSNRYFIPASALQQIVTKDAIRVALSTHYYPLHRRQEALDYVINGGKRVFGILVVMGKLQLLINFIEHDPLHLVQLDAKLPLHESALRKILPEDSVEFFGLQWEFCSPIFGPKDYLHRVYDDEMILPFLEERPSEVGYAHMTLPTVVHASHLPHMQHSGKSQVCRLANLLFHYLSYNPRFQSCESGLYAGSAISYSKTRTESSPFSSHWTIPISLSS